MFSGKARSPWRQHVASKLPHLSTQTSKVKIIRISQVSSLPSNGVVPSNASKRPPLGRSMRKLIDSGFCASGFVRNRPLFLQRYHSQALLRVFLVHADNSRKPKPTEPTSAWSQFQASGRREDKFSMNINNLNRQARK